MLSKIALLLLTFIPILVSPNAFAQQSTDPCGTTTFDCYQKLDFRLIHDPVICIAEPGPDPLFQSMTPFRLTYMTEQAIGDWVTQLSYGDFGDVGGNASSPYMSTILVPFEQQSTFDFWGLCDIQVKFEPQPTPEESTNFQTTGNNISTTDPVGVTWSFPLQHQALITIYYRQVELQCDDYACTEGYANQLADYGQLGYAIRHELGHAFGLGHYMATDSELNNWASGSSTAPSIMLPYSSPSLNFRSFGIRGQDVDELQSIYGNNGFGGQSNGTINSVTAQVPTPEMSPSDIAYWKPVIRDYFENSTNTISSNDYGTHVLDLVDVFDSEQLTSIPDPVGNQTDVKFWMQMPSWFANDFSWWANGTISDNDLASAMQSLYDNRTFCFSLSLPPMHQVNAFTWSNEGPICD